MAEGAAVWIVLTSGVFVSFARIVPSAAYSAVLEGTHDGVWPVPKRAQAKGGCSPLQSSGV